MASRAYQVRNKALIAERNKASNLKNEIRWIEENGPLPLCACGCGQQVKFNQWRPGVFLNSHALNTRRSREANRLSKKERHESTGMLNSDVLAMLAEYRTLHGLTWRQLSRVTGYHFSAFFAKGRRDRYTSNEIVERIKLRMQGIATEPTVYEKHMIEKETRRKAGTRPIWGMMIVRNEADRYLQSVLEWHLNFLDDIFIFDDQSEDETVDLCLSYTDNVKRRPPSVPPFLEHEGFFRQWAWEDLHNSGVSEGDMVLLIDADEFFVSDRDELVALAALNDEMLTAGASSVRFMMPEIWDYRGDDLFIRVDGFWNRNKNIRLVKYREGTTFAPKKMGGGSVPMWYTNEHVYEGIDPIIHFGYLNSDDREAKSKRYTEIVGNGHSARHIASILDKPRLQKWEGVTPRWWRGVVDPSE